MNNKFETSPYSNEELPITYSDAAIKRKYISPELVRIGLAAHETSFGGAASRWDGVTTGS